MAVDYYRGGDEEAKRPIGFLNSPESSATSPTETNIQLISSAEALGDRLRDPLFILTGVARICTAVSSEGFDTEELLLAKRCISIFYSSARDLGPGVVNNVRHLISSVPALRCED